MKNPKVLIACEESQAVTIEFRGLGIEAYSCDTEDCSGGHPEWHIKKDVRLILNDGWDMMVCFPPCTYLSSVANRWYNVEKYGDAARERKLKRAQAFKFVMDLWNAPIKFIAIENPVGYLNSHFRKRDQIIHPWYFGDGELKRTCLWLKNLPPLKYDKSKYEEPKPKYYLKSGKKKGQAVHFTESHGFSKDREKIRSRTFPGIAKAMAEQWTPVLIGDRK